MPAASSRGVGASGVRLARVTWCPAAVHLRVRVAPVVPAEHGDRVHGRASLRRAPPVVDVWASMRRRAAAATDRAGLERRYMRAAAKAPSISSSNSSASAVGSVAPASRARSQRRTRTACLWARAVAWPGVETSIYRTFDIALGGSRIEYWSCGCRPAGEPGLLRRKHLRPGATHPGRVRGRGRRLCPGAARRRLATPRSRRRGPGAPGRCGPG